MQNRPQTIEEAFEALRAAFYANAEVQETRAPRNVAKKAKNIQHGEIVDLPGIGTVEISAWSLCEGMVMLGNGSTRLTVDAETRLRVRKP